MPVALSRVMSNGADSTEDRRDITADSIDESENTNIAPADTDTIQPDSATVPVASSHTQTCTDRGSDNTANTMNTWERCALEHQYPETGNASTKTQPSRWAAAGHSPATDPLIYPGLYSASGFDLMSILLRVTSRPNPTVSLGPIDAGCPLILCDLQRPDNPIVYASDAFSQLTGYSSREVLGRNCRFLQLPCGVAPARHYNASGGGNSNSNGNGNANGNKKTRHRLVDRDVVRQVRRAVDHDAELQVEVVNFRKDGRPFINLLTIVPVRWESDGPRCNYSVGFQCDKEQAMAGYEQG